MAMFGKGAQSTPTSASESEDSASEHVSTSAGDNTFLKKVIAKLRAADNEDKRAQEILAAATTLRDCSGRARKDALRKMANAWGVTLNEKVGAKYEPRSSFGVQSHFGLGVRCCTTCRGGGIKPKLQCTT